MSDTIIATQGSALVDVASGAKVALYCPQEYQVFQVVGFPNFPDQNELLFQGSGYFTSAAFSAAGQVQINAGSAPLAYNVGTAAVTLSTRDEQYQGDPGALNTTGALTAALMLGGIVTSTTAAAVAGTVPTGTVMSAAIGMDIGDSFDWSVINTGGANAFTVTAATDHTVVGAAAVANSTSGRFRTRKTAATVFVTYRLS